MEYRRLGKTGLDISEISIGTWQVGGKWGSGFDQQNAFRILHAAIDKGINFIDTADVYEAGMSETAVGKVVRSRSEEVFVASKCGRRIIPHINEGYTPDVLQKYVEDTLHRTGLDTLDLIQLHCPPTEVYYRPEIFERFERLKEQGKIRNLGVSVQKVEEALKAIEFDNVTTVQIIFNVFRQRPAELFFREAVRRNVGIIVRVPLASGLLSGKFRADSTFEKGDHRFFNRNGESFDKGETFSGIDFATGLKAMDMMKEIFPGVENLAPAALQWILQFPEVSCIIPGVSRPDQLDSNLSVYDQPNLTRQQLEGMNAIYEEMIKDRVHHLW